MVVVVNLSLFGSILTKVTGQQPVGAAFDSGEIILQASRCLDRKWPPAG